MFGGLIVNYPSISEVVYSEDLVVSLNIGLIAFAYLAIKQTIMPINQLQFQVGLSLVEFMKLFTVHMNAHCRLKAFVKITNAVLPQGKSFSSCSF